MLLVKLYKSQIFRYIFVASVNVAAGYGIFAFLIFLGLHYILAVTMATIFGILVGFKAFSALVFNNKNNLLIWKYLSVWAIVYFLNIAGITFLSFGGLSDYLSGFIMLFPSAGLGFLLNKRFVFKKTDQDIAG